ncbi:MAG: TAXI family TRAP transporter solute-binding subunit [Alcaligenaceae bacterium]
MNNLFKNKHNLLPWCWLVLAACLLLGLVWQAPPRHIVIEAGPKGGFFDSTALLLKERLESRGVSVAIINSESTLGIIGNVNQSGGKVDIGFIAHEVKAGQYPNVKSLGSVIMDPLFMFARRDLELQSPADFIDLKLGVGPKNTGGRLLTDIILDEYGITPESSTYIELSLRAMANALRDGEIDVGFFLQPTTNKIVSEIGALGFANLVPVNHASALVKKYGYLHHLVIERGSFSLLNNLPSANVNMVGIPATVVAKKDLHPGIVVLVSLALKDAYRPPTLVSARASFPSMNYEFDLDADVEADQIYKHSPGYVPFLYRVLNFWIAGLLDKSALFLSFLLSAYFFLYYLGFPRAYDYWKLGMMSRYTRRLEALLEAARTRALTDKEAQEFLKIERYLDPKAKASQNAARLLAEIKSCL